MLPPVPSEKLPELTADADVGLILFRNTCLNHYYSLPNKLYEYMMAGVPIIASDLPEIARVIREYDIGRLVDPDDPSSIAAAIRGMAADRGALAESGRRARQAALAHHTWAVQEAVLLDIYSNLKRIRRRAN
jgi:glycosyltransferase involved in cell wall biosynthesis